MGEFFRVPRNQGDPTTLCTNLTRDFQTEAARATGDESDSIAISETSHTANVERSTRLRKDNGAAAAQRPTPNSERKNVDLTVFAVETCHFSRRFTFDRPFLQVGAFIVSDLALANAEFGFEFPVFPVKLKHNQRSTLDLAFAVQFVDLMAVQQKISDTL